MRYFNLTLIVVEDIFLEFYNIFFVVDYEDMSGRIDR